MSFKFQLPPITAESGIDKLRSYLMQMTDQLEYALNNIETSNFTLEAQQQITKKPEQYTEQSVDEAVSLLKDLIVKNAEVIESHMDEISQELHGEYTALSSDFGEYKEESTAKITANAQNITQQYSTIQTVKGDVSGLQSNVTDLSDNKANATDVSAQNSWITQTDSYIKTGVLYFEGLTPITGIALGQIQHETVNGEDCMKRQGFYATFTPQELAFFIGSTKVAYVSNDKLFINKAEIITGDMNFGRYAIKDESGKGLTFKWKG